LTNTEQLPGNRRQAFEQLDQPALQPLPRQPYRYVDIKPIKVNIDYHVQYQQHHYSVPHQYAGETLELHASKQSPRMRASTTRVSPLEPGHMPTRHHRHQQWTPGRLKQWAHAIGPQTLAWVDHQLQSKAHPEQAYRVCLGLLNLSRDYPAQRGCLVRKIRGLFFRSRQQLARLHRRTPSEFHHHSEKITLANR